MAGTLCLLLLVLCVSALLLPPLAHLHAQAPSDLGVCMGNLKQIGMAMRLYLADYNDTFPVANEGDPDRYTQAWRDWWEWEGKAKYGQGGGK